MPARVEHRVEHRRRRTGGRRPRTVGPAQELAGRGDAHEPRAVGADPEERLGRRDHRGERTERVTRLVERARAADERPRAARAPDDADEVLAREVGRSLAEAAAGDVDVGARRRCGRRLRRARVRPGPAATRVRRTAPPTLHPPPLAIGRAEDAAAVAQAQLGARRLGLARVVLPARRRRVRQASLLALAGSRRVHGWRRAPRPRAPRAHHRTEQPRAPDRPRRRGGRAPRHSTHLATNRLVSPFFWP